MSDADVCRYRGLPIWGIFGAKEPGHRRLFCRFHKAPNQRWFGLTKEMGRNIEVPNGIEYIKPVIGGRGAV